MAHNKYFQSVPTALTTSVANLLSPFTPDSGTGVGAGAAALHAVYMIVKHIRVVNKTSNAVSFSLWLGATGASAAGTEIVGQGLSVAANSYEDFYGQFRVDSNSSQFVTGSASSNSALTIMFEGEIGIY